MRIDQQLLLALFKAPASIRFMRKKSLVWMTFYAITGFLVFGIISWLLKEYQGDLKQLFMDYFFPQSWQSISEKLIEFLYESQTKTVLGNLIISGSLVLASIFLFPIKEKLSAVFEKEGNYQNGPVEEFSLLTQGVEESKLLLIYLTAQMLILWIGYYPYWWAHWLSNGLSYLFLFYTFGLDFIAPTLQRHKTTYSKILKITIKKPLLVITFGALFNAPLIFLANWIFSVEDLTFVDITTFLFLANILILTLAVPVGTHIASCLFVTNQQTIPPTRKRVIWSYSVLSVLFVGLLFLHGQLMVSLHHKSQLLKADYDIDWSSFDYKIPSFKALTSGKALSNLSFDLVISNATDYDIEIEDSQITLYQKDILISAIDVNGFALPSGQSKRVTMTFDSKSDLSKVSNFGSIFNHWRADLSLQVWPGIPFIINLLDQEQIQ